MCETLFFKRPKVRLAGAKLLIELSKTPMTIEDCFKQRYTFYPISQVNDRNSMNPGIKTWSETYTLGFIFKCKEFKNGQLNGSNQIVYLTRYFIFLRFYSVSQCYKIMGTAFSSGLVSNDFKLCYLL